MSRMSNSTATFNNSSIQSLPSCLLTLEEVPDDCPLVKYRIHQDVRQIYQMGRIIGDGQFGVVRTAILKSDAKQKYAIKSIRLENIKGSYHLLQSELDILRSVDHPNIINFYETFNDGKNLHIVMQLCTGGELFDRIQRNGRFTERQAALIMKKMLSAVTYLHTRKICHRDIKPENFIFANGDLGSEVKLIDFGLSVKYGGGQSLTQVCGTPYYVAPEVLCKSYTEACDIWSLGVILYILLSGYPPFDGIDQTHILKAVKNANVDFSRPVWNTVSQSAKDLIRKMLNKEVSFRYTGEQCLNHIWFHTINVRGDWKTIDPDVIDRLRMFKKPNKFKQFIMNVTTQFLDKSELEFLTDNFKGLDMKNEGLMTPNAFYRGMEINGLSVTRSEATSMLGRIDMNGNGALGYSDFIQAGIDKSNSSFERHLRTMFKHLDVEGKGHIDAKDLVKVAQRVGTKMKYRDAVCMLQSVLAEGLIMNFHTFFDIVARD